MPKTTPPEDHTPPRVDADIYGTPVAEQQCGNEYYEVYTNQSTTGRSKGDRDLIFVAKYKWRDGEWVKLGLDRLEPDTLFHEDEWPIN